MDKVMSNIFVSLSKYNSPVDENYLTEAFVFLLNSLLENDPSACLDILRRLCLNESDYDFRNDENIAISTQETTEHGRPDIKISSPNKLIYIEVKHDSGLGDKQIERYKKALNVSNVETKKVILLTKFGIDFAEGQEKPDKYVRWFEIYNWLSKLKVENEIDKYLIKSFSNFLEVKNMSLQKVTWEYINGVRAFKNLINMIEVAINASNIKIYQRHGRAAMTWMGFYIESNKILCYVEYDNPLVLKLDAYGERKAIFTSMLNLESVHFFSLDKDEQLEKIRQFIKEKYKEAKKVLGEGKN
jgi:hypothetical protein